MRHSVAQPSSRPTTSAVTRWLIETIPVYLLALLILPLIIGPRSHIWPWEPWTIDLEIYRLAVQDMLAGKDFYATTSPGWNLYYIYPPIVAIMLIPIAVGPYLLWQLLWTFGLVCAQQFVLRRCGVPRGKWVLIVGVAIVLVAEPIRTTLGYGQINTFLMAAVVAAIVPPTVAEGRRRHPAWGMLIGLGAAIKLTPAYFAVVAFFSKRMAVAWWAFGSFCALTALGYFALPQFSIAFWTNDIPATTSGPVYVGNQSLFGMTYRWVPSSIAPVIGGFLAAVTAISGVVAARYWWLRGRVPYAVGVAGLVTCLVTPLSWTHHFVWVVPFMVGLYAASSAIPQWQRILAWVWALWTCVGLPLLVLPIGDGVAEQYNFGQDLIGNFSPLLGLILVVGTAIWTMRARRTIPHAAAGETTSGSEAR